MILFVIGDLVVPLITPDPTLQRLTLELFPLIGIGHVVQSVGVVSWAILGAQGRYSLGTFVQFLYWGVSIPLSIIFTFGLRVDLQGLTSAFILGLALSSVGNTYILIRSQWQRLALIIDEGGHFDPGENIGDESVGATKRNSAEQE